MCVCVSVFVCMFVCLFGWLVGWLVGCVCVCACACVHLFFDIAVIYLRDAYRWVAPSEHGAYLTLTAPSN